MTNFSFRLHKKIRKSLGADNFTLAIDQPVPSIKEMAARTESWASNNYQRILHDYDVQLWTFLFQQ